MLVSQLLKEAKVDIEKYTGQWYEIARLPNSFERGLKCTTATYTLKKNGKIKVLNKGYSIEETGKVSTAKGSAWIPDPDYPGRLKVSFFWPFAGNYYIISLDEKYENVLVKFKIDPSDKNSTAPIAIGIIKNTWESIYQDTLHTA